MLFRSVPALEVVKARFAVVVIAAVTQWVEVADRRVAAVVHHAAAPRAVSAAAQRRPNCIRKIW